MMFTKFELSILSLLIFNFAQDFFFNLAKEDVIQRDIPDEDNVRHYVITTARIVADSVLYSTVITGGLLCPDSFENSLNKLLVLIVIGCLLLFTSGLVSCVYFIYNSLDTMDEWLKIFLDILTLCNNFLFFFNMFFKSLIPIVLAVFCKFSVNLAVTILSSHIPQLIINICTSSCEVCIHLAFIFFLNNSSFSLDLHIVKDIFSTYILFIFNSIFARIIFQFGYLSFLSSEFLLFWSLLVFNFSYCLTIFSPFLEFLQFIFCRSNLDYCKIGFLFVLYNLCFFLPLVVFIFDDLNFLIPFSVTSEFSYVCAFIIPLNYLSCCAQIMNMYLLSKSKYFEVFLKNFVLNLLSVLMCLLFFFDAVKIDAFHLVISIFVIRSFDFPLSLCLFVVQRCHFSI